MEALRQKLESENSSNVLQAASQLQDVLLKRLSAAENHKNETIEELGLLWEGLGSSKAITAQSCSDLISTLVECGLLDVGATVTQLLASLGQGQAYHGIILTLGRILAFQVMNTVVNEGEKYRCPFLISSNPHPFVSVLRSIPQAWKFICDQVQQFVDDDRERLQERSLTFLRPLFLYLFCDPNYHAHFGPARTYLFDLLLEKSVTSDKELHQIEMADNYFELMSDIISWMTLENKSGLGEMAAFVAKYFKFLKDNGKVALYQERKPLLFSLSYHLAAQGLNTAQITDIISDTIEDPSPSNRNDWDIFMIIFSEILSNTAHIHHGTALQLCLEIIRAGKTSQLPTGILASVCLESLWFETKISPSREVKAEIVRAYYANTNWAEPEIFRLGASSSESKMKYCDQVIHSASAQVNAAYILSSGKEARMSWLANMKNSGHKNLCQYFSLLSGLFLGSQSSQETTDSLDLMLKCVKENPSRTGSRVLTLVLHKLANHKHSTDSGIQLSLFKALPNMATDKSSISFILKLLGSLSSKPSLGPLRLKLLYQLWRVEPRCFQFLHQALEEKSVQNTEVLVAKALVIKRVLTTHASDYGSDLLPILSGILNQCTGLQGSQAAILALESISMLCKDSVIDIRTTVRVLAPKLTKDNRPKVLEKYCELLGLAPSFRVSTTEYNNFLNETLAWLWKIVNSQQSVDSRDPISCMPDAHKNIAISAAYKAISKFPLELTKLKQIPIKAREGLKLPAKYCATPDEAARKPEDVLTYVPGECWPRLLNNGSGSQNNLIIDGIKALLRALLRDEIGNLPRSVYHVSQAAKNATTEPVNYNHLPEHSVLRGVMNHLLSLTKQQVESTSSACHQLAICLELLGEDHSRGLPPFDWNQLEPTFLAATPTGNALRAKYINAVCQSVGSSRSAKSTVERLLAHPDLETGVVLARALPKLCRHIPPQQLGPFLGQHVQTTAKLVFGSNEVDAVGGQSPENAFNDLLAVVKTCLEQKNEIPEANHVTLANAIETIFDSIPTETDLYESYIDVAAQLPTKHVERLSSPAVWWEVTPQKLYRAAALRTKLALADGTDTTLTWLNEILEVAAKTAGDFSFLLRNVLKVVSAAKIKCPQVVNSWLLELMGQLSSLLRKVDCVGFGSNSADQASISFFLDMFSIVIIVLTDTDSLCIPRDRLCQSRGVRESFLPLAMCKLVSEESGLAGQVADWSLHVSKKLNSNFENHGKGNCSTVDVIQSSLQVFKSAANWNEAFMWGRLIVA